MATARKRKNRVQNCVSTIALDGALTSSVKVKLVTELLKDIMYQRQQIPMPHSQIVRCVKSQQQKEQECPNAAMGHLNLKKWVQMKKQRLYVQHMSEVVSTLEQVFSLAVSIRRVLIVIGSNSVSPKESYMLQFPTSLYSGKVLSLSQCKVQLFRELVSSPFFVEVRQLGSSAKVFTLVEMPEDFTFDLPVIPKPNYKLPRKGSRLLLQFICPNNGSAGECSRMNDTGFDISGVEPLNWSVISDVEVPLQRSFVENDGYTAAESSSEDMSCCPQCAGVSGQSGCHLDEPSVCRCETPSTASNMLQNDNINCDPYDLTQAGYIWYQLPTCIQGYKDKTNHRNM